MTTLTGSVIAVMISAGIARADNAVPTAGAACNKSAGSSFAMDGSQTFSPQGEVLLCLKGDPAPPAVKPIQAGAPFTDFFLLPDLATLRLTGSCQWRTAGSSPYGP
jgi:hypothetical protein